MVRILALALTAGVAGAQKLGLDVDQKTGAFHISHDGNPFLSGQEVVVKFLSAAAGQLVQTAAPATSSGSDVFGDFAATTFSWGAAAGDDANTTLIQTTFKTYSGDEGLIVFEQHFPTEINSTGAVRRTLGDTFDECRVVTAPTVTLNASEQNYTAYTPTAGKAGLFDVHAGEYCDDGHKWAFAGSVGLPGCQQECAKLDCTCFDYRNLAPPASAAFAQSVFPAFSRTSPSGKDLDVFAYHGVFPSLLEGTLSSFLPTAEGGAPLVVFDADNSSLPMVVFSPLNFPKAQHVTATSAYFGAGVKAKVEITPAGWTQAYVLSAGLGINAGMMAWGDRVLKYTGKPRANPYLDQTHSTIGFWTDNGGE